jgi:hypothetical protein
MGDHMVRKNIVLAFLAAVATIGIAGPAYSLTMIGAGVGSCGRWTDDKSPGNETLRYMDGSWVKGFLAGVGYESGFDLLKGHDSEALNARMDNHCSAHPLDEIADGAEALAKELARRAPKSPRRHKGKPY